MPFRTYVTEAREGFANLRNMIYFRRSVKYLLLLVVLYAALMVLMDATGSLAMPLRDMLWLQTHTWRGWVLLAAVVLLSATYPLFGFVARELRGDLSRQRERVIAAMEASGFRLEGEEADGLIFRGDGWWTRLTLLYEDRIRVEQHGDCIRMEGIRRGVARALYRLRGYLRDQ